ncbi:hypothetical protein [Moorella sp. E308F]|uniref:hypothetical protein n=1 Tax=Moorella sp. E308F TaxID=2572682 RepID=UPI001C0EFBDF|nr:hypothetical protein [Moorella sp. E308F]
MSNVLLQVTWNGYLEQTLFVLPGIQGEIYNDFSMPATEIYNNVCSISYFFQNNISQKIDIPHPNAAL